MLLSIKYPKLLLSVKNKVWILNLPKLLWLDEGDVGVDAMKALGANLSKLGATPTDDTKVSHPVEKDEDPADEFFGKRPN